MDALADLCSEKAEKRGTPRMENNWRRSIKQKPDNLPTQATDLVALGDEIVVGTHLAGYPRILATKEVRPQQLGTAV